VGKLRGWGDSAIVDCETEGVPWTAGQGQKSVNQSIVDVAAEVATEELVALNTKTADDQQSISRLEASTADQPILIDLVFERWNPSQHSAVGCWSREYAVGNREEAVVSPQCEERVASSVDS
jgi:hypothetical protein